MQQDLAGCAGRWSRGCRARGRTCVCPACWIACSMASITVSRSIPFSRATASATWIIVPACRAAAASMPQIPLPAIASPCFVRRRLASSSSVRASLALTMSSNVKSATPLPSSIRQPASASTQERGRATLRPSTGGSTVDDRLETGKTIEILQPDQRPVDAGGADFQIIGAADRVLDIEQRRNRAADSGAILDDNRRPVGALGHDL